MMNHIDVGPPTQDSFDIKPFKSRVITADNGTQTEEVVLEVRPPKPNISLVKKIKDGIKCLMNKSI